MSLTKKPKTINPDEVDPSIYYYDEVYDDMKNESDNKDKESNGRNNDGPKGSKYIQGLMENANQRKSEKELRKFKKYARDREEAESDAEETDIYITPTYKKKLEEIQRIDEAKRRRIESERDRAMNFFKRREDHDKSPKLESKNNSSEAGPSKNKSEKIDADTEICPPAVEETTSTDKPVNISQGLTNSKRPKTPNERREYLREILAKRTVGEVFEAALKRYKERMSLASK